MASENIILEIKNKYNNFTKSEKKVADVVLNQTEEVMNATITDLAEICGVGDTTVFRFCRSLNLKGYQDFKMALALSTNVHKILDIDIGDMKNNGTNMDICADVYHVTVQAISQAYENVPKKEVGKVVDLMMSSHSIYFFGIGGSAVSALEAHNKFMKIRPNVHFTFDSHMQMTVASLLGEGNLAVILSNSGTTKDCIKIAEFAKKSGAKVVFITMFEQTPAREYCDIVLVSGAHEGPMQGGSISAKMNQLYIINILYTWLFYALKENATENKKITASVIVDAML